MDTSDRVRRRMTGMIEPSEPNVVYNSITRSLHRVFFRDKDGVETDAMELIEGALEFISNTTNSDTVINRLIPLGILSQTDMMSFVLGYLVSASAIAKGYKVDTDKEPATQKSIAINTATRMKRAVAWQQESINMLMEMAGDGDGQ